MRLSSLPVLTVLACGVALAGDGADGFTYLEGNLNGITANTGGTIAYDTDRGFELKMPLHNVAVPYAGIIKAQLGASRVQSESNEPLYKIWTLPKRFAMKPEFQSITVDFKNAQGQQTMTLELSKSAANDLQNAIDTYRRTVSNDWWGDKLWKTSRNKDQWSGSATLAQK